MSTSVHDRRRGRAPIPGLKGAAALSFATLATVGWMNVDVTPAAATAPDASKVQSRIAIAPEPDFANPTGHAVRGEDHYGAGAFGASRGGGVRAHRGADYISEAGEIVRAPINGVVSRIGFAYRGDTRFRYVELSNASDQRAVRVLYVGPMVQLGAPVQAGDPIGHAQDLSIRYPRGITNHVHVEFRQNGALTDPAMLLPASANHQAS